MRPEVGTQAQFRKKKAPATYRYDSSLSPALDWDGGSGARELGEWLLRQIDEAAALDAPHEFEVPRTFTGLDGRALISVASLREAVEQLKRLGQPFLNWTGKAERLSFDVPTLPLFVHERQSTKTIVETLVGHKRQGAQQDMWNLFGDPQHSFTDQVLRAYEYQDKWVNRLILGDSLVVMNSLLQYEGLGGQVQMIYIDPPYGVKFGSNFQPFVRKRDVSHNDDEDLTREPEMVKAYRDTWELGLHSYLTYMRDRLVLARDLLTPSGSVFVQISDENLHHVREILDEVFGRENAICIITFRTTAALESSFIGTNSDYLLWYGRDREHLKYRQLYLPKTLAGDVGGRFTRVELPDGTRRSLTSQEREDRTVVPVGGRIYRHDNLASQGVSPTSSGSFSFDGREYRPPANSHWKTMPAGLDRLAAAARLAAPTPNSLTYVRYLDDFPLLELSNVWTDTQTGAFTESKTYVVQTNTKVISRCLLMTTDPGELVLDPTCGSGTTAYVAEEWGRRWITIDTSRVPLALARQRLLTATYPYYQLQDSSRGPASGFVYKRKQNKKGEEVGGIVPHITLKSIANDEPPEEEVLVDRPEKDDRYVRVTGPFAVEATIPTPVDWEADGVEDSGSAEAHGTFVDRMTEVLRRSPVLHLGGGKTVNLWNVRQPAKTLSLSAEAMAVNGDEKPVAFVFGPENGAVSEKLVHATLQEATLKSYAHLYVIGFAIQPHARDLIEKAGEMGLVATTYVQATPDLMMGDLLKNMRSSQIFSVCGLPDVKVHVQKPSKPDEPVRYQIELLGVDTFDPVTMDTEPQPGANVPAWLLDTDYNDLCFRASQVFFPRTSAWESLRKALKADYDDSVWDHLAGTTSAPFEAGEHGQVAVKVIDDRGNELLVVKKLTDR